MCLTLVSLHEWNSSVSDEVPVVWLCWTLVTLLARDTSVSEHGIVVCICFPGNSTCTRFLCFWCRVCSIPLLMFGHSLRCLYNWFTSSHFLSFFLDLPDYRENMNSSWKACHWMWLVEYSTKTYVVQMDSLETWGRTWKHKGTL